MQVSWIDPKMLKALVEQIAPQEERAPVAEMIVEIDTAPEGASAGQLLPDLVPVGGKNDLAASMEPAAGEPAGSVEMVLTPGMETTAGGAEEAVADEDPAEEHDSHGHVLHNAAAALPLSRIRDKLRAIRQRAAEAGILTRNGGPAPQMEAGQSVEQPRTSPPAGVESGSAGMFHAPAVAPFRAAAGTWKERLAAFAGWARHILRENGGHVLVMSDEGEVLWGGEVKAGLLLSTMMAWGAAMRGGVADSAAPPVMRQPLASGHVLTVIPCQTAVGVVHAAVAAPEGLAEDVALVLRGALCAALEGLENLA